MSKIKDVYEVIVIGKGINYHYKKVNPRKLPFTVKHKQNQITVEKDMVNLVPKSWLAQKISKTREFVAFFIEDEKGAVKPVTWVRKEPGKRVISSRVVKIALESQVLGKALREHLKARMKPRSMIFYVILLGVVVAVLYMIMTGQVKIGVIKFA